MTRRSALRLGLLGAAVAPIVRRGYCKSPSGELFSTLANDIVRSEPVIDMMGLLSTDWPQVERWRSNRNALITQDLNAIRSSQVSLFHPAVRLRGADQNAVTSSWLDKWVRFADLHPDKFLIVRSLRDWDVVRSGNRLGLLLGAQDSEHFGTPADVERFSRSGQRVSQLTYNSPNRLGGGCTAPDPGLSSFGAAVIEEMNRVGMIVDVSHCGPRTTMDAFEASRRSVLITHSNCAALTPGRARCKSDELIRRMAGGGGVMGVTAIASFVCNSRPVRFEHVLDHFDHVARLVGVEHVGLGTDAGVLGWQRNLAPGFGMPDSILRLTEGLLGRGYSAPDVRRMLGGNFERVLREHLSLAAAASPAVPSAPLSRTDRACLFRS